MFIKNLWPCVASDALFQTTDKLHQPTDYLSAESEHNDILPSSLSSFQKDLYIYIYTGYILSVGSVGRSMIRASRIHRRPT